MDRTRDDAMCDRLGSACDDAGQNHLPIPPPMNPTSKGAGQCGFKPSQLTKAGGLTQRYCVALYLLREMCLCKGARYVERLLGALHSGRMAPAKRNISKNIGFGG